MLLFYKLNFSGFHFSLLSKHMVLALIAIEHVLNSEQGCAVIFYSPDLWAKIFFGYLSRY